MRYITNDRNQLSALGISATNTVASRDYVRTDTTAKAGGGAVEATVTGSKELKAIKISKEAVDPDDVEMLQDLIVAAVNEAMGQADQASSDAIGKMTGGLGLGGGLGF